MNISHKIINLDNRDYHVHSMSYSDGMNTVDEIVRFAGEIGMSEVAITDHSDAAMTWLTSEFQVPKNAFRYLAKDWRNVHNDVSVIFWVEADILNEDGDICDTIQGFESEFVNLSAHKNVYRWDPDSINRAYENAIERHHEKIKCVCHPCSNSNFWRETDIASLVRVANKYSVPLELNAKYLRKGATNIEKLHCLLRTADRIYVNSDAHVLHDLKEGRKFAIEFLKENGYV